MDRLLATLEDERRAGRMQAWSLCTTTWRRLGLGIKDAEPGNAHAPLTLSEGSSARYLVVGGDGRVSRGVLERRQLEGDPQATLAALRVGAYDDPDAAQVASAAPLPEVELHDAECAALAGGAVEPLESRLRAVVRCVVESGRRTWSGSFGASESDVRIVTSAGLDARESATSWSWWVTFDGAIGSGYAARAPEDATAFEERLQRLADLARRLDLPGDPVPPGRGLALLHPRVVEDYVLGTLFHHLDGSTVDHGEGRYRPAQFAAHERVLREDLTLGLDPLQPLRTGSYRFTGEGVPAARCTFLEHGRLVQPVLDLKYARRLGLPPTPLPAGYDAVTLAAQPTHDLATALSLLGSGVLVLAVLGVHTQDAASGDFSLDAPQALRIANGELGGKLRATIAGNLFEALVDRALALVRFPGEHTPGLLLPCHVACR